MFALCILRIAQNKGIYIKNTTKKIYIGKN